MSLIEFHSTADIKAEGQIGNPLIHEKVTATVTFSTDIDDRTRPFEVVVVWNTQSPPRFTFTELDRIMFSGTLIDLQAQHPKVKSGDTRDNLIMMTLLQTILMGLEDAQKKGEKDFTYKLTCFAQMEQLNEIFSD